MLVAVTLPAILKYARWGLPGAYPRAWLDEEAHRRLLLADGLVREKTNGSACILVWDALRAFETQRYLFDQEVARCRRDFPLLSVEEAEVKVSDFVRPPLMDQPPPHTTGGAVDVTLWLRGTDELLGDFDDFSDFGWADHFIRHPPRTADHRDVDTLRKLLRWAMREAGFVGIEQEWWHFEWGTRTWAAETRMPVVLDSIRTPPEIDTYAENPALLPPRQLIDFSGAAHAFGQPLARVRALVGETKAHYYARTRHPNERNLAAELVRLVPTEDAVLTCSGLSAVVTAVGALMKRGGRLIIDKTAYYECGESLADIASAEGWEVLPLDLDDPAATEALDRTSFHVIFCDHPRNWLLTCPDLERLKALAFRRGAKLVVDTSVQPLQSLLADGLADLVVMSLSKYPSVGDTVGGAILGSAKMLDPVGRRARSRGLVISPEAAITVQAGLRSIEEHIETVSHKARAVAEFLRSSPLIADVRLPELSVVEAQCGGQISCRFKSPDRARAAEDAVGWNAARPAFPLVLMCTIGAAVTTFEHFDSRNSDDRPAVRGSDIIGPGWVRIALGYEPLGSIVEALKLVLHAATEGNGPYAPGSVRPEATGRPGTLEGFRVDAA